MSDLPSELVEEILSR
ncbi:hypothetical protein EUTSA_v10027003mg, partial [Eutrema salsugineum]